MKAVVTKSETCSFVAAPPSKSAAHRAVILAALAEGASRITNFPFCDDTRATLECVRALGAGWYIPDDEQNTVYVFGAGLGGDLSQKKPCAAVECGRSASTLRFLLPLLCQLYDFVHMHCDEQLFARPQNVYEELYSRIGHFERDEQSCCYNVSGQIKAGKIELDGSVSSQFVSGIMLLLPLLDGDSELVIKGQPASRPYFEQTLAMMSEFGIEYNYDGERTIRFAGNQRVVCTNVKIEADYSNSAVFMVLGAINNGIDITGIDMESNAPDAMIIDILQMANVRLFPTPYGIHVDKSDISPLNLNCEDFPDLVMLLCVLSAFAIGEYSVLRGVSRLRYKETDRLSSIVYELRKAGANIGMVENDLAIYGGELSGGCEFDSRGDHRLAMACAVLAASTSGSSVIDDAGAVDKSYPDFWHALRCVGVDVKLI